MYVRGSKFYADYRDASGTRHRKSFTTAALALEFERAQAISRTRSALKQLKNGPALAPLPTASRTLSKRAHPQTSTSAKPLKRSSKRAVKAK